VAHAFAGTAAIAAVATTAIAFAHSPADLWWWLSGINGILAVVGPASLIAVALLWWRRAEGSSLPLAMLARATQVALLSAGTVYGFSGPRYIGVAGFGYRGDGGWIVVSEISRHVAPATLGWLVLAWPTGRLSRTERRVVGAVAAVSLALGIGNLLVQADFGEVDNPVAVADHQGLAVALFTVWQMVFRPVVVFAFAVMLVRRERRRDPGVQRLLRPGLIGVMVGAVGFTAVDWLSFEFLTEWMVRDRGTFKGPKPFGWVMNLIDPNRLGLVVVAVGLAIGSRRFRSVIADRTAHGIVVDVGDATHPRRVAEVLSDAIADPTVRLWFRTPDGGWVGDTDDAGSGGGMFNSDAAPGRAVTYVSDHGERIAAVEHDARITRSPALIEAGAAATAMSMRQERLQVLARQRQRELDRTRIALVEATDGVMAAMERDLHDGAQQRLVSLALALSMQQRELARGSDASGPVRLQGVREEIEGIRLDVIRVARGLAPSLVAERGLDAALDALVQSSPIPISIECVGPSNTRSLDLSTHVRFAIWYVVSEAVANSLKYAAASSIQINVTDEHGAVAVTVTDNGAGGADARGAGLSGLRDRLGALGGELDVVSQPRAGTCVRARIPQQAVR